MTPSVANGGASAASMTNDPPPATSPADPVARGPGAPPPLPVSQLTQTIRIVAAIGLLIAFAVIAIGKIGARNELPPCDGRQTRDMLSNIFKSRQADVARYDGVTTRDAGPALIACTAAITMVDHHKAEIDYEISHVEGGRVQVKVTGGRDK